MKYRYILSIFLICLISVTASKADSGTSDSTKPKRKKRYLVAAPSFTYAPETRFGAGIYGLFFFRFDVNDTLTKGSVIDVGTIYTQNKQYYINPTWKVFSKHEDFAIVGEGIFQYYTEKFFGIGKNASAASEEIYSHNLLRADTKIQRKLFPRFYGGLHYIVEDMFNVHPYQSSGALAEGRITGSRGGFASGLGLAFTYDSRLNLVKPAQGELFDIQNAWFGPWVGSEFTFYTTTIDARKYFKTYKEHILAVQLYGKHVEGDAPFRMMALLGGPQIMRGYYYGRYRDNNLLAAQAEYRMPVLRYKFLRFDISGFAGTGDVAHRVQDFSLSSFKPNYGFGLRYIYNEKENLDVRLDVGFGQGTAGVYVTSGEAF